MDSTNARTAAAAGLSFGGSILAEVTNNPTVATGSIVLSLIGLLALVANLYAQDREKRRQHADVYRDNAALRDQVMKYRAALNIYEKLLPQDSKIALVPVRTELDVFISPPAPSLEPKEETHTDA